MPIRGHGWGCNGGAAPLAKMVAYYATHLAVSSAEGVCTSNRFILLYRFGMTGLPLSEIGNSNKKSAVGHRPPDHLRNWAKSQGAAISIMVQVNQDETV